MRALWMLTLVTGALALQACVDDAVSPSAAAGGESGDGGSAGADNASGRAGESVVGGSRSQAGAGARGGEAVADGGTDAGGASSSECSAAAIADLVVFSSGWDALGYPPYAIDDCTLLYVSAAGGGGALHRRDLATGEDTELDGADAHPRRPTVSGGVVAWERDGDDGPSEVRVLSTAPARDLHFARAGEPRATRDALVFTRFLGPAPTDDTDVMLYDVVLDTTSPIAVGDGQQRFADVSPTDVALTDFSEDPNGYYRESGSLADVIVVNRATGVATVRAAPGKQAFPLLGDDGLVVYLEWGAVHPEPKFGEFTLKAGNIAELVSKDFNVKGEGTVRTDPAYVRPSLHGVHVDYVDYTFAAPQLYRATLRGSATALPAAVEITGASALFGPASANALTIIAKPLAAERLSLFGIDR